MPMPFFPVILVIVVAVALGGYAPWGELALELGAAGLFCGLVCHILWGTSREERRRHLQERRALKSFPFFFRHSGLGVLLRALTFQRFPRSGNGGAVEIVAPGERGARSVATLDPIFRPYLVGGYPLPRTGLEIPVLLLTLWIALSLAPLSTRWLGVISPRADLLRGEAGRLVGAESTVSPVSLAPFVTGQSLWVWLALLAVFYFTARAAEKPRAPERLTFFLFWTGIAFGAWGIGQWLLGLSELVRTQTPATALRASASFGNRNHYALFMEMTLLPSLGWLGYQWTRQRRPQRGSTASQEAGARLALFGLGIVIMALGLFFSLSRSGVTFALVGCAAFAFLAGARSTGSRRVYWSLGLAVAAAAVWIGISPVVERFELVPQEWEEEKGRWSVWRDSLRATGDFWPTGSGLGSFAYVFPLYRTFGGTLIYLWAHNDYLQLLVELGAPGLLLVLALLGAIVWRATRVRQAIALDRPLFYLHAGYCAAGIAVALHSFTDFGLHMPANTALAAVVTAVIVGVRPRARD